MTTECEVPGCTEPPGRGRPVCSPHWAQVPYSMQQAWWRQHTHGDEATVAFLRGAIVGYGIQMWADTHPAV